MTRPTGQQGRQGVCSCCGWKSRGRVVEDRKGEQSLVIKAMLQARLAAQRTAEKMQLTLDGQSQQQQRLQYRVWWAKRLRAGALGA